MDMNNAEVTVVAEAAKLANDNFVLELNSLELAFCGGGVGEVVLA